MDANPAGEDWLDGARVVVQPAFLEDQPRKLLRAIAEGVPVIATPACGVAHLPGVTTIPAGDVDALIAALR
jgi:glycosyltransferase involved in cell wall biosynthesis